MLQPLPQVMAVDGFGIAAAILEVGHGLFAFEDRRIDRPHQHTNHRDSGDGAHESSHAALPPTIVKQVEGQATTDAVARSNVRSSDGAMSLVSDLGRVVESRHALDGRAPAGGSGMWGNDADHQRSGRWPVREGGQSGGSGCRGPEACAAGLGYLAAAGSIACGTMDAAAVVCCFPTCGGTPVEMPCCGFQVTTRPLCSSATGSLSCPTGTSTCPPDQL